MSLKTQHYIHVTAPILGQKVHQTSEVLLGLTTARFQKITLLALPSCTQADNSTQAEFHDYKKAVFSKT